MNCEHYAEAIGELVDGAAMDEALRIELDKHLRDCASCRDLLADLRHIRAAATRLPMQRPPAGAWDRIASQLPAATSPSGPSSHRTLRLVPRRVSRRVVFGGIGILAVAATLLLVLALPGPRPGANRQVASTTSPAPASSASGGSAVHANNPELVQSVESELRLAEQHYEKAIAGLEQIANAGEGALDPQLAGTLRKNLAVIDQAIHDSRDALQAQPTNELAQESLFEAFRRKAGLLQDTVALINEMRKGNQAEAAKIIGSMNKS